jgi:hypothetical protein
MRARFRIWFVVVVIAVIVFVLQTFFAAEVEALLAEYGRNEYLETAARVATDSVSQTGAFAAANWPEAVAVIEDVPDFWWGALTIAIVWGLLEMIYAASRKPVYGAGIPIPTKKAEIEEARLVLNQRRELLTADARRELAATLDDLYADGAKYRNSLIPPLEHFNRAIDFDKEEARLEAWNQRALKALEHPLVAVAERSRFRTLDSFQPEHHPMAGKSPHQEKIEGIWNEKLKRLRAIIDSVGAEPVIAMVEPARGRQFASSGTGGRG